MELVGGSCVQDHQVLDTSSDSTQELSSRRQLYFGSPAYRKKRRKSDIVQVRQEEFSFLYMITVWAEGVFTDYVLWNVFIPDTLMAWSMCSLQ